MKPALIDADTNSATVEAKALRGRHMRPSRSPESTTASPAGAGATLVRAATPRQGRLRARRAPQSRSSRTTTSPAQGSRADCRQRLRRNRRARERSPARGICSRNDFSAMSPTMSRGGARRTFIRPRATFFLRERWRRRGGPTRRSRPTRASRPRFRGLSRACARRGSSNSSAAGTRRARSPKTSCARSAARPGTCRRTTGMVRPR